MQVIQGLTVYENNILKIIQVTNILIFVLRAFETLNAHVFLLTLQFWDFSRLVYVKFQLRPGAKRCVEQTEHTK